jgi:hypothetical protein
MWRLALGLLVIVVGCNLFPSALTPPEGLTLVPGGISNTQPYFGNYKLAGADVSRGTFMLASCGCGDWRVLFKPDDGSAQTQFPIQFYSLGDYKPTGSITIFGQDDLSGVAVSGTADQDGGLFTGQSQAGLSLSDIAAMRGDAHELSVKACGLCHIGDDAIYPLPPWHPPKYKTNPLVCLECHSVDGQ